MMQPIIEDLDGEIQLDLRPKEAKPKVFVEEVVLRPELTLEQAEEKWRDKNSKRWLGQNLDKSIVKYRPEVSTFYRTPDWHAKLLLLRGVLDADFYAKAYERVRQIKYTPAANSKRAALKGSPGGEALFGFNDQMQVIAHLRLRQKYPEWTAPSVHQFPVFRGLWPICWNMEDLLREYMPTYWQGREIGDVHGPAPRGDLEENEFFKYPEQYRRLVRGWSDWGLFYSIPGSNFSTLTANWNTIFRAHKDARNSSGALSCLAAFGTYRGGKLCFPRLGVAIDARERDLLICDCPRELHGTLPLLGTRYSVVAYTREGLTRMGTRHKHVVAVPPL
jgi:hypothetical protein